MYPPPAYPDPLSACEAPDDSKLLFQSYPIDSDAPINRHRYCHRQLGWSITIGIRKSKKMCHRHQKLTNIGIGIWVDHRYRQKCAIGASLLTSYWLGLEHGSNNMGVARRIQNGYSNFMFKSACIVRLFYLEQF